MQAAYQIKVTLKDWHPPTWRRLLVPEDLTLVQLRQVLAEAMGWSGAHEQELIQRQGRTYRAFVPTRMAVELDLDHVLDEAGVLVRDVLRQPGDRLRYVYDLGENWRHDVLLEKVQRADPGQRLPVCLKGKRACPLEDRGGPFTCEDPAEVLADPGHEDHAEILELVGEDYDPDAFDLEAANRRLAGLTGRWG